MMKKQELMSYKKRVEGLLKKMDEIYIIHDFRNGCNYLGYSYQKESYYCLAFRTGRREEVVYKGVTDNRIRRLLYGTDENDLLTLCLTVEDIFKLMKENDSYTMFETIFILIHEALNDALFMLEDAV